MTELVPARVDAQIALAKTMAHSNLLPRQYQQNPANLMWAIQYAEALGVHPMTAVTGIHVIEGKPTASAQLIGGLVRRAGHKLRVTSTDTKAVAQVIRQDDPDFTFTVEWTIDKAKAAGLTGKGVWKSYPAAMLASRAITEVARLACPEALFGVIYTAEELGASSVDEHGAALDAEPITAEVVAATTTLTAAEHIEEATAAQVKRIHALRNDLGLTEDQYRAGLEKIAGVTSSKQLSKSSAGDVIEAMEAGLARRHQDDPINDYLEAVDVEIVEEVAA